MSSRRLSFRRVIGIGGDLFHRFLLFVYSTIYHGNSIADMRTPEKLFPHMSVFAYGRLACRKPATTLRSLRPECYRSFRSPRLSTRRTGRVAYRRRTSRFSIRGMGEPCICYRISRYRLMRYSIPDGVVFKENTRRAVCSGRDGHLSLRFMTGLEQGNSNLLSQATRIREPSFVPLPVRTGYCISYRNPAAMSIACENQSPSFSLIIPNRMRATTMIAAAAISDRNSPIAA